MRLFKLFSSTEIHMATTGNLLTMRGKTPGGLLNNRDFISCVVYSFAAAGWPRLFIRGQGGDHLGISPFMAQS
jgi:hypothetical protein